MSTRVGPHIFDIDLEDLTVEQLQFLKSGCDCFITQKKVEKWENEFTELNINAHVDGFHLCYVDEDGRTIPLNTFNFKAVPKSSFLDEE